MRILVIVFALLIPVVAHAQTPITRGPVPLGTRFAWEAPDNVTTVTDAQSFEPRLYRTGTPLTALTGVTCAPAVPPVTGITCTSVITQSNLDAINAVGVHALTLSLFRADVGEGTQSVPFTLTTPSGAPRAFRAIP